MAHPGLAYVRRTVNLQCVGDTPKLPGKLLP